MEVACEITYGLAVVAERRAPVDRFAPFRHVPAEDVASADHNIMGAVKNPVMAEDEPHYILL